MQPLQIPSGAGAPLWTNRYDGFANSNDYAAAIAVDGSGNVVVTGNSYDSNGWSDYATIKYSSTGVPLWTNRYNGPGNQADYANGLAVDKAGAVFVTGNSWRGVSGYDFATIKYSSAGVPLWTNRYNGSGNGDDRPWAIAVDGSGNVVVTGISTGANGDYDYVTIKYLSVSRPLLSIARTTTNALALSWPSLAADFTLQQNTNVATTNWTAVVTTPAEDGTNKTVIVDPPEENRFYRLAHP